VPSVFFGFEIARRALDVSQLNLQIIAHNIANANTPGYSRQRAELITAPPLAYPSFTRPGYPQQIGSGVDIKTIDRIRDEFLDEVIRNQIGSQGRNEVVDTALGQMQLIFNEPSETGLSSALSNFFAAWQDLANNPESVSTRANLREQATTLVQTVNSIDSSLKQMASDQTSELTIKIQEANTLTQQIASLNIQIANIKGLGESPNDLMDQRDNMIEQLSQLVPVTTIEDATGSMSVLVGGYRIVEKDQSREIRIVSNSDNPNDVSLSIGNNMTLNLQGKGHLAGLIEIQKDIIPFFQDKLDNLISAVINRVNVIHNRGFGLDGDSGRAFFGDVLTADMIATSVMPTGTTEDTTIDELGITTGDFEIQGAKITITQADIAPGQAITLGQLIDRITASQPNVRASLETSASGDKYVRLALYNPPDGKTAITTFNGTSNFLTVAGLEDATNHFLGSAASYSNAARMLQVSVQVKENLDAIAAAYDVSNVYPGPGNNTNALAIASLETDTTTIGRATFGDYYNSVIGELGSRTLSADQLVSNQQVLLDQLQLQSSSTRGVNIDEETTNMITYQRIYEGAARVIQVIDSMLDTLMNRIGA
jgi:flagellar hook-associated protein 1